MDHEPFATPQEGSMTTTELDEQGFDAGQGGTALVVGEALIDVVERHDSQDRCPGGSPMNVATGLARLGRRVELATWYGTDEDGRIIDAHLAADGVTVQGAARSAPQTSTATARIDEDGQATYSFDVDWSLPDVTMADDARLLHAGSLAIAMEPGRDAVLAAIDAARGDSTITLDPNIRPDLIGSPAHGRALVEETVRLADVVKASDEDLSWLGEGAEPEEVLRGWLNLGPALVVMTCGGSEMVAMTREGLEVRVPAVPTEVVDTVGAGDSFMAGLIDGLWTANLLGGSHREALAGIDGQTLRQVLEAAARIAAITVSRAGANPPHRDEL